MNFYDSDPWGNSGGNNRGYRDNSNNDIDKVIDFVKSKLKGSGDSGKNFTPKVAGLFMLVVVALWALSGFYTVNPEEAGVELIFGKHYNTARSGLHYNLPSPIGQITKVKVETINKEDIGYRAEEIGSKDSGEGVILTGDENIVSVNFEVQWRVEDPYKFLYKIHDSYQGLTVKNAAESAMREAIGQNSISFILRGEGRAKIALATKDILQTLLNSYDAGVEVISIQMKKVDPPEKVLASFRDVQSARSDAERASNEAMAYSNDILPRAGAEANKIRKEAEGYKIEVVNRAKGDAERFKSIYLQYKDNPSITKNRMLLDSLEFIYKDVDKVIVDNKILPFLDVMKK